MKARTAKKATKPVAKRPGEARRDAAVDAVFAAYPGPVKAKLLALRRLIFDTANSTEGEAAGWIASVVGAIVLLFIYGLVRGRSNRV
jgi:hypothetical protein